jgi:sulfite exporter TauE/SafE
MMTSTVIAFGTMMVPIGFSLLGLYFLDPNHNEWLRNCGLLSGAIGFIAIWKAVDRAKKEDDEAKKRHEELIDTIRDINKWDK